MSLDRDAHLGALWRDGLALADAAERAGLGAPVVSCGDWTVADLLWHTGEVHLFWRTVVLERWEDPSSYAEPERPLGDELLPWYREGVQRTVEALTAVPGDERVWTWAPRGGTAAWVARRMAQETAVHRWDAELATGTPTPVDPELAVDGVDEFFEHFTDAPGAAAEPIAGTVHLHCTDGDGEWLIAEPDPDGRLEVTKEHAKGDAAVRATASDLLLLLWRRVDLDDADRFQVFGDPAVAHRLVARTNLE